MPPDWVNQRNKLRGAAQLKFDLKHFFIDAAVGQVEDLSAILRDFPAEMLLADFCFLGAAWLHEQTGLPWAGVGISILALKHNLQIVPDSDRSIRQSKQRSQPNSQSGSQQGKGNPQPAVQTG